MEKLKPKREYTDWHRFAPERYREMSYNGDHDWFYYYNLDWEDFLISAMILYKKDYAFEGGMPWWFKTYIDEIRVVPFDHGEHDISFVLRKPGWARNVMTYHLEDGVSPGGMTYNVTTKIEPEEDFLNGKEAVGCPQSVWEPYLMKRIENLRYGTYWNPSE